MGFYLHMFMTVFLPCVYGRPALRQAAVAPQRRVRAFLGKN
jgi:hypothetical protein